MGFPTPKQSTNTANNNGHSQQHNHSESSCHDHSGSWNPYHRVRGLYGAYWVPFLFWFGEWGFDGRAEAGKVSSRSRMVRLLVTSVRLIAMQMMVDSMEMSYRSFIKEGAEVPLWFGEDTPIEAGVWGWVAIGCMAINMLAILYGSAANHHKIQQYYDQQIVLKENENAGLKENENAGLKENENAGKSNKKSIPHGWHAPRPIFWVNAVRYLHDANGLAGTALSSIIFMSVVADMCGDSLGIGNTSLGKIFFASNLMALLSVALVPLTTKARLWAHEKVIVSDMQKQVNNASDAIKNRLSTLFQKTTDSPEKTALYYHAVKACELVQSKGEELDMTLLKQVIDKYIDNNRVSRTKIKVHGPWLDALDLIETQMVAALRNVGNLTFIQGKLPEKLLRAKMDSRGIETLPQKASGDRNSTVINKIAVTQEFPVNSNPHGKHEFVAQYHTEQMLKKCGA